MANWNPAWWAYNQGLRRGYAMAEADASEEIDDLRRELGLWRKRILLQNVDCSS